jgi:hypothetical protein
MDIHTKNLAQRRVVLWAFVFIVAASILFYASTVSETVAVAESSPSRMEFGVPAATFAGANLGGIADGTSPCWNPGTGAPRNVTFNATGLSGAPAGVDLSVTFGSPTHTFVGDITAVLIAPNGASHTLFGHTLATTATSFGDSSDLGAQYIFSDSALSPPNGGWWQAATAAGAAVVMPTGTYRTTASGGAGATNPQPPTSMNPAFAGVSNPNGTWTLRITDSCAGDTGSVTAATLAIFPNLVVAPRSRADFDGDGKTDLSVFRPSEGNWYLNRSTAGFVAVNWGLSTDIPAPGDFDGDNKTDTAIFRPSTGTWWIVRSGGGLLSTQFGATGDIPVAGDYDGDNTTDVAVFRPSTNAWYVQYTAGGTLVAGFGAAGDVPVRADYNGDGMTDIAVFRPSTGQWWVLNSGGGGTTVRTFGNSTDKPVPADYDGDNKDDVAIFRPSSGQWWSLLSLSGTVTASTFGLSTDVPVPGDYDGDGRDDQAVYRNGVWWLNRSTAGITAQSFGLSTDVPIPAKYIP